MDEGARLLSECGVNSLTVGSNPTLSANIQFLCFWIIVYHYNRKNNRKFKKLRRKKDLSQDRLSKLADISYNTVIKLESGGITNPTIETLQKIAKASGVSVDDLLKS